MRISGLEIDAVSFDVDGTMYSQPRVMLRFLPELYAERRLLEAYVSVRERMRGRAVSSDMRREFAARAALACGMDGTKAYSIIERLIFSRWPAVMRPADVFPGLRELLGTLADAGARIAAVSDYPVEGKLRALGLDSFSWAALADCETAGALKPAAGVFSIAAQRMGVEPSRVLHVGDREDCDVAGAHAAGMKAALFARGVKRIKAAVRGSRAEIVFHSYMELSAMVTR
jgi:putative hydrolase of the HAD superfamily